MMAFKVVSISFRPLTGSPNLPGGGEASSVNAHSRVN
jgi:hypothetical protein